MFYNSRKLWVMLSNENGGDGEIRTHGTELTVRRLSKALPSTTRARLQVI